MKKPIEYEKITLIVRLMLITSKHTKLYLRLVLFTIGQVKKITNDIVNLISSQESEAILITCKKFFTFLVFSCLSSYNDV